MATKSYSAISSLIKLSRKSSICKMKRDRSKIKMIRMMMIFTKKWRKKRRKKRKRAILSKEIIRITSLVDSCLRST